MTIQRKLQIFNRIVMTALIFICGVAILPDAEPLHVKGWPADRTMEVSADSQLSAWSVLLRGCNSCHENNK